MSVSSPIPQNLLHLLCSCSNEWSPSTWSSELGAIETLFVTPLYQLCPPSGWQLYLGSDAFSSHNHSPTFCLLSHTLLQWHPRDLPLCQFPWFRCVFALLPEILPYKATLAGHSLQTRTQAAYFDIQDTWLPDPKLPLQTYFLLFLQWTLPLPKHCALSQLESRERNWHNPERSTQSQVGGTIQSPPHNLPCQKSPVPSLPGIGHLPGGAAPTFPRWLDRCFVSGAMISFVPDPITAFTPLCPKLFSMSMFHSLLEGSSCAWPSFSPQYMTQFSAHSCWTAELRVCFFSAVRAVNPDVQRALNWDSGTVPGPALPLDMWPWVSHSVSFIKQGSWTKWSLRPL